MRSLPLISAFRLLTAIVCLAALAGAWSASAQEFRIETKVFAGEPEDDEVPQSESLTLCRDGVIYDFLLSESSEIAVFKTSAGEKAGRFILLDPARKIRTELTTDEILLYISDMQRMAAEMKDPLVRFAANPKFEETFNTSTGDATLASAIMSYHVKTQPAKDQQGMSAYREYCDWYARFNAMIHERSLPPHARLVVNAMFSEHMVTAKEVELTIPARRGFQPEALKLRAVHHLDWRLSKDDSARIDQANEHLVMFRLVDFAEYRPAP